MVGLGAGVCGWFGAGPGGKVNGIRSGRVIPANVVHINSR